MILEELFSFIKKKGFRDVLSVLTSSKNHKLDKHSFYSELNKFSYYNSFFRVKEDLLDKGIIEIENHNKKKYIKLTDKGLTVYQKLEEINDILKNSH